MNSDKKVSVYDNQVKAREYVSYISESAGGFACAGRDGKIYIKTIGEDEAEIPLKLFKTYKFGEEYEVSKVAYEDGVRSFKFGDETRNTLWINQDNMFIVDEEQVENIYNKIKGLTINSFEGTAVINPAWDMGDKIIIDGKPIIYQGEMSLNGRFVADIKSKISIKQKQETTVKKASQKVINRRVQSQIDQENLIITQLVEETTEHEEKLTQVEQDVDSIKQSVKDSVEYKRTVDGITQVHLTEAGQADILELEIKGNKTYDNYLYPSSNLYPSPNLYPNDTRFDYTEGAENSEIYNNS